MPTYTSKKPKKGRHDEERLNAPMSSREEAVTLMKTMQEHFGPDISVVVLSVDNGYVCHCIKKGDYKTKEEVGDNEMIVTNKYFWDIVR